MSLACAGRLCKNAVKFGEPLQNFSSMKWFLDGNLSCLKLLLIISVSPNIIM